MRQIVAINAWTIGIDSDFFCSNPHRTPNIDNVVQKTILFVHGSLHRVQREDFGNARKL